MTTRLSLRLASVVTMIFAAGHLFGFWRPSPGDHIEQAAQRAMMAHRFDLAGTPRTFWEIYLGFGLIIGVFYLSQAIILWLLSSSRLEDKGRAILLTLIISNVALFALLEEFLFIIPQVLEGLIALLLLVALWRFPNGPEYSN